jgi:alkylation response protein AidB-like acyl-CoA dehydrogenase
MIADMAMQLEAARALLFECTRQVDRGDFSQLSMMASMAKCYGSDVAMKVTTDAVQIFGGVGYLKDYPVERMMRDAKINQIWEGTNQIQRIVISRHLLGREA